MTVSNYVIQHRMHLFFWASGERGWGRGWGRYWLGTRLTDVRVELRLVQVLNNLGDGRDGSVPEIAQIASASCSSFIAMPKRQ